MGIVINDSPASLKGADKGEENKCQTWEHVCKGPMVGRSIVCVENIERAHAGLGMESRHKHGTRSSWGAA